MPAVVLLGPRQVGKTLTVDNANSNIQVLGVTGDGNGGLGTMTISSTPSNIDFGVFGYYGSPNLENSGGPNFIADTVANYSYLNGYSLFKLGTFNPAVFAP